MLTSLANVKTYMGLTGTSKDAIINLLLPAVSKAIEKYCDRAFDSTSYSEYIDSTFGRTLYLPQYPIIQLKRLGGQTKQVLTIENTSADATAATIQIDSTTMYLNVFSGVNAGEQTLTLATYATITLLAAAITALATGWVPTINAGCDAYAVSEIITGGGGEALTAERFSVDILEDFYTDFMLTPATGRVKLNLNQFPDGRIFAEYTAGYATIPTDLALIAIRVIAQMVKQAEKDLSIESERWPHYQYKLSATNWSSMLRPFEEELNQWRRVDV